MQPPKRGLLFKGAYALGPFDRVLLVLYTLFFTALCILFAAVMLGWSTPYFLFRNLFYPGQPEVFWPLTAILVLAGIRLLWSSISKPDRSGRFVVLSESAMGQTRISIQAMENLAVKVVSQINGVREVKSRIVSAAQGVGIQIQAVVTPDINIPEISASIQDLVKEKVFAVTGVTVKSVAVTIKNISAQKPRVE